MTADPGVPTKTVTVEALAAALPEDAIDPYSDWNREHLAAAIFAGLPADDSLREALERINAIRNSIIGSQQINWSEHIYPLVAALNEAGFVGVDYPEAKANIGTLLERNAALEAQVAALAAPPATPERGLDVVRLARALDTAWDDGYDPLDDVVVPHKQRDVGYHQLRPAPDLAARIAAAYALAATEGAGE